MKRYGATPLLLPFAGAALLLTAGCLTSTQATRLQTDLDQVKQQLFQIQQDSTATRSRLDEIDHKTGPGAADPSGAQAELQATMQTLLDRIQALQADVDEIRASLARTPTPGSSLPGGAGTAPPAGSTAGGAPSSPGAQTFNAAYADYSKGNYELSTMGFEEFLRTYPSSPLAGDAQYWIGECLYSQGKFSEAVEAFDKAVTLYPDSDRTPAALLKKGYALIEAGQTSRAVTTLQQLIQTHPDSEEARLAEERLKSLGLRAP